MDILELVHEDRSTAVRPFVCTYDDCVKGFARKSDLVRHERIHTNERPWNCEWPGCKRDFIQRSALIVHMRTHTGERPHKCEYAGCSKAFSDSSSLARHRRIHTGKRPYQCAVKTCLKTFCRKTTLTKHIKKNHPQWSHSPNSVSLASFGDKTPQLAYTPSIASSAPQTPSDDGSAHSDDEDDERSCELPNPPAGYSYFPPHANRDGYLHPSSARQQQHQHHDVSPGAWSAPGHLEGYPDVSNAASSSMERSVSHETQAYLTPPPTHETRFRSSRRTVARSRGRYREYDEDEDEFGQDDDDEDYVEGREEPLPPRGGSNKTRRNAVALPAVPPPPPPPSKSPANSSPGKVSRRLVYATPSPDSQFQPRFNIASLPPQDPHFVPLPEEFVTPPMPQQPQSYAMHPSHTAPIPSTYAFEHTAAHQPQQMTFAAPPLRRASSFSALENHGGLQGGIPSFEQPAPALAPQTQPQSIGLGLSIPSFPQPLLHERRLSDLHYPRSAEPSYSYEDYSTPYEEFHHSASACSDPNPLPSSSMNEFLTVSRPYSAQDFHHPTEQYPRRGSIGFPSLPSHLNPNHRQSMEYTSTTSSAYPLDDPATSATSTFSAPPLPWSLSAATAHQQPARRPSFSQMTSRLLDRFEHEQQQDAAQQQHVSSGMVMASY